MKKLIVFLFIICALLLVGCNGSSNDETLTDLPEQTEPEVLDPSRFNIFFGDSYQCRIIVSDKADDVEKAIYNKIRDKLRSLTGKSVAIDTDFLAYNDAGENRKGPAILIGYTNYDESKQVYDELRCGESIIRMVGNKLVIAFSSETDASTAYVQFNQLLKGVSKTNVSVAPDVNVRKVSDKTLNAIPTYRAGKTSVEKCGNDTHMIYADKTGIDEFEAYRDKLEAEGFAKRSERTVEGNVFYTYVQDKNYIYMYYKPSDNSARIILGPIDSLADEDQSADTGIVCEPSLTIIGQSSGNDVGQGYVFLLPDGRFIVQDGGYRNKNRADNIYKSILEIAPDPENIVIAAWFMSHPHIDHQQAIEEFLSKHKDDENLTIESFVLNYAPSSMYSYKRPDGYRETSGESVDNLFSLIKRCAPEAKIIKAHTGQMIKYGEDAYVEVLYTAEDYLPAELFDYVNSTSLVIRVTVSDTAVLLLADTTHASGRIMEQTFGDYLRSDMVQLAHHGKAPSNSSLYELVKAEVLLWPTNYAGAKGSLEQYSSVINTALSYANDLYISDTAVTTLPLPYETVNNKDSEVEKIK
jgi:beta-lactamase superfamily II metal-dependent hydrolase